MRLLGVDYGTRRTGLALGETEFRLATPFEMFEGLPDVQLAEAIAGVVRREGIELIVVGQPLNQNGSFSPQTRLTERFILTLQQTTTVPVVRQDEHLTSHHAEGQLAGNFTRKQKRQRVDALAAARILQDYMDGMLKDEG